MVVKLFGYPLFADDALEGAHLANIYRYAVKTGKWDVDDYSTRSESFRAFKRAMQESTSYRVARQNEYNDWVTRMSIVHDDIERHRRLLDERLFGIVASKYNNAVMNQDEF